MSIERETTISGIDALLIQSQRELIAAQTESMTELVNAAQNLLAAIDMQLDLEPFEAPMKTAILNAGGLAA